jgi:hypothetical protein
MPVVEVVGVRGAVRAAKASADTALLDDLSGAWRKAERLVMARMELRAAATGLRADRKVADTLRGSSGKDRAAVRFGNAALPWWGGAVFGAHHNVQRPTAKGPRLGWNQFPEPRPGGSWPYEAVRDTFDDVVDLVEREVITILTRN